MGGLKDELLKAIWHAFTALDLDHSGKVSKSQLKVRAPRPRPLATPGLSGSLSGRALPLPWDPDPAAADQREGLAERRPGLGVFVHLGRRTVGRACGGIPSGKGNARGL